MPLYSDFGLYYSPHLSTTPSYYSSPFLGTSGRSSGLGLFPAPRVIPRVSPLLPSIPEASSYVSSRPRTSSALDRYIPTPSPPCPSRYKPLRIDTADIDVSSNRYGSSSSSHGASTPQRDNTIKRGRTVVRLHTKKCKENPTVEPRRKMTPGEKLMQKFLILDKAEEEAKAARRKRLEEQEIRERAEAEVARLQALAAAKNTPETESPSAVDASQQQTFPTIGGITENAALDILLSTTEDEEHTSGGEISRSGSSGTIKRRKSKGTLKASKRKSKQRKSSLVSGGDDTDSPNGNGEDPVCSLQRRNTVRFRRNSQDIDAFPEVDLTCGSRRSSIDQSLPGSRRSSLDSSTGDEIPLAIQKKGTVKRRKDAPHRIVVAADVTVDNDSSSSSLNSPKLIVDDVKVEQSTAPKVFRYEVIVEDVEGESLTSKHKVSKEEAASKKKKKASDSDRASSESEGISVSNIKSDVPQSKGEKKDSEKKSFQKSQPPFEVETVTRLNARKTDEIKTNFKSKEDAENLPLKNVGKKENGTNKNEKGVKQMNVKNNKLNQKNVDENKTIQQAINTQKNAPTGGKMKIQSNENKPVLEKNHPNRQADPIPVEDSSSIDDKESKFNFWDQLKPDEKTKTQSKQLSPTQKLSSPDVNESDTNKNSNIVDGNKVEQAPEKKPVPKWKEKLQNDKNVNSEKTEEMKQICNRNDDKKSTSNMKSPLLTSKSDLSEKVSKLTEKKTIQEDKPLSDPFLNKKDENNQQKPETLSATSLVKENISCDVKSKDKTHDIEVTGKQEEGKNSQRESVLSQTDQKQVNKINVKSSSPDNKPLKQLSSATEKISAVALTKKLNESTEKRRDINDNKSSPASIQLSKEVTQESSPNVTSKKIMESPEASSKNIIRDSKNEPIKNEIGLKKPATGIEINQASRDALSKPAVISEKPPVTKRFAQQKSKEDLPKDESPLAAQQLVKQKSKDETTTLDTGNKIIELKSKRDSPNKESAPSNSAKKLVEQKKEGEDPATKLMGQKSKQVLPKDERSIPVSAKKLVGQKSKEDSLKGELSTSNTSNKLIGQKNKEDQATVTSDESVGKNIKENSPKDALITFDESKKLVGQESKEEAVQTQTATKLLGQKPEDKSQLPGMSKKLIEQKGEKGELAESVTKKFVGQKIKGGSPKDEPSVPTTTKKLVRQNSKDSPKDEPDSPTSAQIIKQKSNQDASVDLCSAKKLVGQKSKEDSSKDESTASNAAKTVLEKKSKEDESGKPSTPKKLVGQKSKEEVAVAPTKKKLGLPKSKEETPKSDPATTTPVKKLVGQKSKQDERVAPSTAKQLITQKSKEEEIATPTTPKKMVELENKKDDSRVPAPPKKAVVQKGKAGDALTTTTSQVEKKSAQPNPSLEPDTLKSSPAGKKKIIAKGKVEAVQSSPSDKPATAKQGIPKKKTEGKEGDTKPASKGTKLQPPPMTTQSGSDADSEESSSEDEESSTPRNSSDSTTSCSGSSTSSSSSSGSSSSDSGFDSRPSSVPGSPPSNKKVSSTASEASGSREPGSPAPSAYSATLDPYSEDAGLLQAGSGSGRTTPPATSLPRFRKYTVDDFQFLKLLGKGTFGKVLLAELRGTDRHYAVKCLKKDVVLEDDDVECTLIERKVLALGTKHPYLCHLFCTFQTESHLLFVMEYLNGGDLMFHIQQSGRFPEPRARFYAAEIVCGLKFLHKKGIVYRDLKLDNILLDYEGHVRIADFGMCKLQIFLDRTADTFCGTPDYMAPEIIKGLKYNQCVDWWSFGVLTFEMVVGVSPFSGCDEDELFWSICNEQPQYPRFLSREAHSLLAALLEKDALKRLGTPDSPKGDVPDHVFFRSIDWGALERRELEPPFRPRVKHPLDVQYFDTAFTAERPELTPVDASILQSMDQAQFHGFSYTNPNATD